MPLVCVALQTILDDCRGSSPSKFCHRMPSSCSGTSDCTYIYTHRIVGNNIEVELFGRVRASAGGWVAVGYSRDDRMVGDADQTNHQLGWSWVEKPIPSATSMYASYSTRLGLWWCKICMFRTSNLLLALKQALLFTSNIYKFLSCNQISECSGQLQTFPSMLETLSGNPGKDGDSMHLSGGCCWPSSNVVIALNLIPWSEIGGNGWLSQSSLSHVNHAQKCHQLMPVRLNGLVVHVLRVLQAELPPPHPRHTAMLQCSRWIVPHLTFSFTVYRNTQW